MQQLTASGQQIVNDLSQRHGFSTDAVTHMLYAVHNGRGTMAQFSHPEFGGSGQWMLGGMVMVGDMFNNHLKGRVDSLCTEISNHLASRQGEANATFQSQTSGHFGGDSGLFVADPHSNWWPKELGSPSSSGSQNSMRYAYFPNACRLAVDAGGEVWVYDTQAHQIGGFSQQQGSSNTITFSSQFGNVNLSSLPVISRNGIANESSTVPANPNFAPFAPSAPSTGSVEPADIYAAIERLGSLRTQGILTETEFSAKKAELLARI